MISSLRQISQPPRLSSTTVAKVNMTMKIATSKSFSLILDRFGCSIPPPSFPYPVYPGIGPGFSF
jgi:hypothetical protein